MPRSNWIGLSPWFVEGLQVVQVHETIQDHIPIWGPSFLQRARGTRQEEGLTKVYLPPTTHRQVASAELASPCDDAPVLPQRRKGSRGALDLPHLVLRCCRKVLYGATEKGSNTFSDYIWSCGSRWHTIVHINLTYAQNIMTSVAHCHHVIHCRIFSWRAWNHVPMASYIRIASSIISWWLGSRKDMIKERGAFFSGIKMICLWRTICWKPRQQNIRTKTSCISPKTKWVSFSVVPKPCTIANACQ